MAFKLITIIQNGNDLEQTHCQKLKILDFDVLEYGFQDLLNRCSKTLTHLDLSNCSISSGILNCLIYNHLATPCHHLKKINLTNCTGVTSELIYRLCENNSNLTELKAMQAENRDFPSYDTLKLVTSLPKSLRKLDLYGWKMPLDCHSVSYITSQYNLEYLALSLIHEAGIFTSLFPSDSGKSLRKLKLQSITLNDRDLERIVDIYPNLTYIELDCPSLTTKSSLCLYNIEEVIITQFSAKLQKA